MPAPKRKSAAHAIPPYDKVVRALGDEPWDIELEAALPADLLRDIHAEGGDGKALAKHKRLAERVRRYKNDFPAFCEEVLKIRTKKGKLIPFKLKKAQRHVWFTHIEPAYREDKPLLIYLLKGRQIGFSTLTQAVQYWRMSLWPYLGGLTAAHSTASAGHIYGMLRLFYRNAPADFRPMQKHSNRHELFFAHKSDEGEPGLESRIVVATAADEDLGAGYTLQMVHLSEFARYDQRAKDVDQIMATMLQAVPDDTFSMVVAETTGEGDNFAADFWRRKTFTNVFIPWVADERYTALTPIEPHEWSADPASEWGDELTAAGYIREHILEWWADECAADDTYLEREVGCRIHWRRNTLKQKCNGKIHLFHKQYPLIPDEAFSGGGKSIFDSQRLSIRLAAVRDKLPLAYRWSPGATETNFQFSEAGELRMFEEPQYRATYVIGVDVAIGHEDGDYSVAQVFKLGEGEQAGLLTQVATYQAHINPSRFGELLVDLAHYYNFAFLVPESTGAGAALIEKLKDLNYSHMFVRKAQDTMTQQFIEKWGFHTSPHTKNLLVDATQDAILMNRLILNDAETIKEMLAYTADERGRLTAPKGKHDDLVIGTCLAVYGSIDMKVASRSMIPLSPEDLEFERFLRGETPREYGYTHQVSVI